MPVSQNCTQYQPEPGSGSSFADFGPDPAWGRGPSHPLARRPTVSTLLQQSIMEETILIGLEKQVTKMVLDLAETNGEPVKFIRPEARGYLEDFAHNLAQQLVL